MAKGVWMRKLIFAITLTAAACGSSMASASTAVCADGFTADPDHVTGGQYDQSYVCTGPKLKCSDHFSPQGSPEAVHGGVGGSVDDGPAAVIKHDREVYTCAEPPSPPK
jgi:hypothetical protein